jgi:hypothetical protein
MRLKMVVTASDPLKVGKVRIEDYDLVDVLGDSNEATGVELNEIIRTISETISGSITTESELTVEIEGSISLKAQSGVKWLFFNVGGEMAKSNTLKVVVKTKISPG